MLRFKIVVLLMAFMLLGMGCQSKVHSPAEESNRMSVTTEWLVVPEGRIAFDDQGEGQLIMLLPGLGDLRQSYRFLIPILVESGYRVVSVDLRGHGESSVPWADYSTQAVARDVLDLIAHLDAGPAVLVGNSFSACVAVWAATEQPDAVAGVSMIGPFVRPHEVSFMIRSAMVVMFNGPWKVGAWGAFHRSLFTHEHPEDYAEYQQVLRQNLAEPGRFAAVKAMIDRDDTAVAERLTQLTVPVQIIMGEKDPDYPDPAAEAAWIAAQTYGVVALLPNLGHYPQAEAPQETATALLNWLQ